MMSITLRNPLPDLDFFRLYILMIEEDEHCCGGEYSPAFWSVFKIAQADDYCEIFLPVIEIHYVYYNIDKSGNKYLGWDMMGAAIFGVVQNLANSLGCILSEIFALPRQGGRERPNFGFPQILNCISWCRPNSHSQLARHLPSFSSVKYEQMIWC